MISEDKNVESLMQMIETTREYLIQQEEYLKLSATDKIVRLMSAMILAIILFVILIAVMFHLSMAAVEWMTTFIGRAEAYAIAAFAFALMAICVYLLRKKCIERPLTVFMTGILLNKEEDEQ